MDEEAFRSYVRAFNENEFDEFSSYYADDVVFELGDRLRLEGRDAIVEFYRNVGKQVEETLEVSYVIADGDRIAAELVTEFRAIEDVPDFIAGSLASDETLKIISFVHYELQNGRFSHIKSARYMTQ